MSKHDTGAPIMDADRSIDAHRSRAHEILMAAGRYQDRSRELNSGLIPGKAPDSYTLEEINESNLFGVNEFLAQQAAMAGEVGEAFEHREMMRLCLKKTGTDIHKPFFHKEGEGVEVGSETVRLEQRCRATFVSAPIEAAANAVRLGDSRKDKEAIKTLFDKKGINERALQMLLNELGEGDNLDYFLPADVTQVKAKESADHRESISTKLEEIAALERRVAEEGEETDEDKNLRGGLYNQLFKEMMAPDKMSGDALPKQFRQELYLLIKDKRIVVQAERDAIPNNIRRFEDEIAQVEADLNGFRASQDSHYRKQLSNRKSELQGYIDYESRRLEEVTVVLSNYQEVLKRLKAVNNTSGGLTAEVSGMNTRVLPDFAGVEERKIEKIRKYGFSR